jgi:hypothetical protein
MKILKGSLSFSRILGLIFTIMGILLALSLLNYKFPISLKNISIPLQFGAAIGSFFGGLLMLFKRNQERDLKVK